MRLKKFIKSTLILGACLFEFTIDIFIALIIVYIINLFNDRNIILDIISYGILTLGLMCGFNEIFNIYKNKDE